MRRFIAVVVAVTVNVAAPRAPAEAQASGERPAVHDTIVGVVEDFFTAMETRDTAALTRLFLPDARSAVIGYQGDSSAVGGSSMAEFRAQLPSIERTLLERMWNPQVLVHRGLAVVWTPYDFHVGGRFSHCGVDAFTLLRTPEGWRISGVAYTVETTGCSPSPLGPPAQPSASD